MVFVPGEGVPDAHGQAPVGHTISWCVCIAMADALGLEDRFPVATIPRPESVQTRMVEIVGPRGSILVPRLAPDDMSLTWTDVVGWLGHWSM
ncbi:MAG: hypothetical protein SGPRY_002428, partial [Prymnesium sp.]